MLSFLWKILSTSKVNFEESNFSPTKVSLFPWQLKKLQIKWLSSKCKCEVLCIHIWRDEVSKMISRKWRSRWISNDLNFNFWICVKFNFSSSQLNFIKNMNLLYFLLLKICIIVKLLVFVKLLSSPNFSHLNPASTG